MLLHFDPHLGDQTLRRGAQKLNKRIRRNGLHQDGPGNGRRDGKQQVLPMFLNDIVDEKLCRAR